MLLPVSTRTSFQLLHADGDQRLEWLDLLSAWSGREVFAHPDYLALHAGPGERPVCAVYRTAEGQVIYPVLLRGLRAAPFWGSDGDEVYDTVSPPYGYGGPFVDGPGDRAALVSGFFREYEGWASSQGVVAEYLTLCPKDDARVPYPGSIAMRAPSVVRELALSPDELWRDYKGSVRTDIRTAQRAGVTVEFDESGRRAHDFLDVYTTTMRRRNAAGSYAMTGAFLERLHGALRGDYVYCHAGLDGTIVSTELALLSADSTFFFRGGTRAEAWPARPNHLLKHELMLWSLERGKRFYLLGGGNAPDDSLYRYKLAFAPRGARPLRVGTWIVNHARYDELVGARRAYERAHGVDWAPAPSYFPAYRAPSAS
jgi:hypothetical protein